MTVVTIHQPMYLPYPGFFNKIKGADIFVLLDDAEYSSGYYYNRNRIKGPNGQVMLTVPVIKEKGIKLKDMEIAQNIHWEDKHWKSLVMYYSKSMYFEEYMDFFENIYSKKWKKLNELNMVTMNYLMEQLDLEVPLYLSSQLLKGLSLKSSERLLEICKRLDASTYLSGVDGKNYLNTSLFDACNIEVKFQKYIPKEYTQLYPPFIPNLSIIDLLFNMGVASKEYINF
ncbi:MAG: WbqC family protein [Candidatus Hodarchaeales archaeon]|jgi:hypothetical protein